MKRLFYTSVFLIILSGLAILKADDIPFKYPISMLGSKKIAQMKPLVTCLSRVVDKAGIKRGSKDQIKYGRLFLDVRLPESEIKAFRVFYMKGTGATSYTNNRYKKPWTWKDKSTTNAEWDIRPDNKPVISDVQGVQLIMFNIGLTENTPTGRKLAHGQWIPGAAAADLGTIGFFVWLKPEVADKGGSSINLKQFASDLILGMKEFGFDKGLENARVPASAEKPVPAPAEKPKTEVITEVRGDDDLLKLWNQQAVQEKVTEEEREAARKVLRDFIEKERARYEQSLSSLPEAQRPHPEAVKNAAALKSVGVDTPVRDMVKHESSQEAKVRAEFAPVGTGPDAVFTPDVIPGIAVMSIISDMLSAVQAGAAGNEPVETAVKQALKPSLKTEARFPDAGKQMLDSIQKQIEKQKTNPDAGKPTLARELLNTAVGKAEDYGKSKTEEFIKKKLSESDLGKKAIGLYDKGGKLKEMYDSGKEVIKTLKDREQIAKDAGDGAANLYVGFKCTSKAMKKLGSALGGKAGEQIGEVAGQMFDAGAELTKAASTATYEFDNTALGDEVNLSKRQMEPVRFLRKAGKENMEGTLGLGYELNLDTEAGQKQKIQVGGMKKLTKDGRTQYVVLDSNGNQTEYIIDIKGPGWLKFWGDHKIRVYNYKTGKTVSQMEMDL